MQPATAYNPRRISPPKGVTKPLTPEETQRLLDLAKPGAKNYLRTGPPVVQSSSSPSSSSNDAARQLDSSASSVPHFESTTSSAPDPSVVSTRKRTSDDENSMASKKQKSEVVAMAQGKDAGVVAAHCEFLEKVMQCELGAHRIRSTQTTIDLMWM
jgi:hypothetical protein